MRSIIPFAAIILALIAAGSIAYIASQLVKDASEEDDDSGDSE